MKNGFSLIEIIIAFAIITIVFVSAFEFATTTSVPPGNKSDYDKYLFPMYKYGEKVCYLPELKMKPLIVTNQLLLDFISTSTIVTSMHSLSNHTLLITTDSSSTSEKDIYIIDKITFEVKGGVDVGPGIQDSLLLGNYLYIANTSINSHIKVIYLNLAFTDKNIFKELQSIKINSLTQSGSMPKKLNVFNHQLILGTEKSNTGGELFSMKIESDGLLISNIFDIEINGQVHKSVLFKDKLLIANAADPELRMYDNQLHEVGMFDAPLTLGNGKSVSMLYPYIFFGRTIGSGELSMLEYEKKLDIFSLQYLRRTYGTVDFLQLVTSESVSPILLALTGNSNKELQVLSINNNFNSEYDINLPVRVSAFECIDDQVLIAGNQNNIPTIIWLTK